VDWYHCNLITDKVNNMKFKGNFWELTLNINGIEASGTFQKNGTLSGEFINNTFKGQWENNGMEGLVEFTITDNKLEGSWKVGIEPGPMRGKWEGSLLNIPNKKNIESMDEVTITEQINDDNKKENSLVKITISGRISNYIFGIVRPEYFTECKKAIKFSSDKINDIEEFMTMLYKTTLESDFESSLDEFRENMNMEDFEENCPLLFEFLESVEAGYSSHYQFYETILEQSQEEVNVIEGDAYITISLDEINLVSEKKLSDFLGEIKWVDEDDDPEAIAASNAIWSKQSAFFNINESNSIGKAENGILILDEWIEPLSLKKFKTRQQNVTVEHDNIVDFDYYFEAKDFNIAKLAFLKFSNMADFHESKPDYIGSYLFYENELIRPEMNVHRDKGFTFYYEPDYKSCGFLIDG